MERITVRENEHDYHLFFVGKNLKVHQFDKEVLKNPLHFLKFFSLSPSSYIIQEKKDEKILYDPESNLYHRLLSGKEDWEFLFYHNGEDYSFGKGQSPKDNNKLFRFKNLIVCISLASLLFLTTACKLPDNLETEYVNRSTITIDYLKNALYNSHELTKQEKDYLYNEDFLRDILPIINNTNYIQWKTKTSFKDISIVSFEEKEGEPQTAGYYLPNSPNVLFMRDYREINLYNEDILAHEFIHLCQDTRGYNLIIEACAEIISNEYYSHAKINSYEEPVKLIKILMEIIGPDVIWNYNFISDFNKVEEKVRPYLNEKEYREFVKCLSFDTKDDSKNQENYKKLYAILEKLYKRKFNADMEDNEIIMMIKNNYPNLTRYYFNNRYINQENSYYTDPKKGSYETISFEEAIAQKRLTITAIDKRPVSFEEAMALLEKGESIAREILSSNENVNIIRSATEGNKTIITCVIDHKQYNDMDLDELVAKGLIKVNYFYIASLKECTYEEYIKHDFNETTKIYLTYAGDTALQEDGVYCYQLTKNYIPPIKEQEKIVEYIKK